MTILKRTSQEAAAAAVIARFQEALRAHQIDSVLLGVHIVEEDVFSYDHYCFWLSEESRDPMYQVGGINIAETALQELQALGYRIVTVSMLE